ncbi:MAG: recombinase family protein [Anaeroplasmataceae bacterium]
MKSIISTGLICLTNNLNIEFSVCKIEYILNEDESFKYIFTPYYDVIELLDSNIFQGIPGLELSLRKSEYIRENMIPTFISERVPSQNREDYFELLDSVGLSYMDPIQYLIKSDNMYSGDNLYVKEYKNRENITIGDNTGKANSFGIVKILLDNIAHGNYVYLPNGICLNNKSVFHTLQYIYEKGYNEVKQKQRVGIEEAKEEGKYKGRKPIEVDKLIFLEQLEMYENGKITFNEALVNLNISKSTFYRLKDKFQK